MKIISMATYSYNKWIPSFVNSIRYFNPDQDIAIYLINYPEDKVSLLKEWFPGVEFLIHNDTFPLKPQQNIHKDTYLVTYLKGQFMKQALQLYNEDCLWIDITSLIRTDLSDVKKLLSNNDVVLIQRNPQVTQGKSAYAAEIFGINYNSKECRDYYEQSCENLKTEWFADQLSLCNFPTTKVGNLEFQVFCNFYYSPEARTWSDRGKTGNGKIEADDADYTINKYLEELNNIYDTEIGYTEQYESFLKEFDTPKPKILVFIDDDKWCYYTTAMEVVKRLSHEFDFTVIRTLELDKDKARQWEGDYIWARCGAYRAVKILNLKPRYKDRIITTITTGGDNGIHVAVRHIRVGGNHKGVFTQNKQTLDLLKEHNYKGEVYLIPNGVDTERFKPGEKPESYLVGFAGRNSSDGADNIKGYTKYFLEPCLQLGMRYYNVDGNMRRLEHKDMPEYYNKISVLVQASANEGCSNTIMEAMASGIPCIITRVGYHGEVCEDGVNCVFVERDEDASQVKAALTKLRDDEDYYNTISKGAREFALKHTWEVQAEKVKQTLKELLK